MVYGLHSGGRVFTPPRYPDADKSSYGFDYRNTVYWNPSQLFDASGHARLDFYNTDAAKKFLITVEGISDDGNTVVSRHLIVK